MPLVFWAGESSPPLAGNRPGLFVTPHPPPHVRVHSLQIRFFFFWHNHMKKGATEEEKARLHEDDDGEALIFSIRKGLLPALPRSSLSKYSADNNIVSCDTQGHCHSISTPLPGAVQSTPPQYPVHHSHPSCPRPQTVFVRAEISGFIV